MAGHWAEPDRSQEGHTTQKRGSSLSGKRLHPVKFRSLPAKIKLNPLCSCMGRWVGHEGKPAHSRLYMGQGPQQGLLPSLTARAGSCDRSGQPALTIAQVRYTETPSHPLM